MTGPSAYLQAAALRTAFPQYAVSVITTWWDNKPRIEAISRDGDGDPYCLISSDARDIWRALRGY